MNDASAVTATQARNIPQDGPLLFGCTLDGEGGCALLDWEVARDWDGEIAGKPLWLHLDRVYGGLDDWLE